MLTKMYNVLKVRNPHKCRYIFVPKSWVICSSTVNTVGVLYPDEEPKITEARIRNNEPPSVAWNQYYCQLLYSTDDYGDAKLEVMKLKCEDTENNSPAKIQGKRKSVRFSLDKPACKKPFQDTNNNVNTDIFPILKQTSQKAQLLNAYASADIVTFLEQLHTLIGDKLNQLKRNEKLFENAPPKFDKHGTKWTLRHRNKKPGLAELWPESEVYIREDQFPIITSARNQTELIQYLLVNIFTEDALSYCTLQRTNKRLDQTALWAIVQYVKHVAEYRNWPTMTGIDLKPIIRQRLNSYKKLYNKYINSTISSLC